MRLTLRLWEMETLLCALQGNASQRQIMLERLGPCLEKAIERHKIDELMARTALAERGVIT